MFPDLAPLMWHSFGTMIVLLQEMVSFYPALSPPTLSASVSNRACNVLALLQSVASHPETRIPFLKGTQHASLLLGTECGNCEKNSLQPLSNPFSRGRGLLSESRRNRVIDLISHACLYLRLALYGDGPYC
ncbi:cell differentiation protein rcd1-like [Panicum virgatum]|uniref:cell differentiation protein rcd1-like n=1 Tax=Panicum virgatum TaxID=38727 RepID=UPI0019D57928|nr:cell differentiation protein rcd1-like [Panicum virgatum]XP_039791081.1 cell differentiation protein rcd1-like [Panicum virgatum]XP_039791082.1 cell differentiation protein rcd1-like [Panicum virgatum]